MIRVIRLVKEKITDCEGECVIHYDAAVEYGCPVDWKNEPLVKGHLETRPRIKVNGESELLPDGN